MGRPRPRRIRLGSYELDGATLVVEPLAATVMECDDERMAQDAWLAELLESQPTLALAGSELTLTHDDVTIVFTDPAANDLDGTTWRIEQFETGAGPLDAPDGAVISFGDGEMSVATGCNVGFGPVTIGDGTISFEMRGQTMVACEGDLATFETALFEFLQGELSYAVDGRIVTLTDGSSTLTLEKAPNP